VAGLPSGAYYARAWDPGDHFSELYDDVPCPDGWCGLSGGTQINVTAGATRAGVDFDLVRGGRVMGTVTDAASGAGLQAYVTFYTSGGAWVTSAYANRWGDFRTPVLPAGTYFALTSNNLGYVNELYDDVYCPGGSCFVTSGTPIVVTVGATRSGVDFVLAQGGRISGTVTDAGTALPLSGQSVHVYDAAGNHVAWLTTDASGVYTSPGLPSASYHVKTSNTLGYLDELYHDLPCASSCAVTSGTPIAVSVGATRSGIDFALTPGGRVSGRVTDAATGQPLAGVWVDVRDSSGQWSYASTDSSGSYTTSTGLLSGTYYASTSNSLGYVDELYDDVSCPSATCTESDGTPITISGGVTTGVDFALARGGRVAGTVTDASTGLPLQAVWVRIYDSEGNLASYDTTDSTGAYATEAVPPGTYYVKTGNSVGCIDELYDDNPCPGGVCALTSGTSITVTAGSTTAGIDFALAPGGRISGTVRDASTGSPLSGVQIRIHASDGSFLTYGYTNGSGVYTTASGLLSGTYYAVTSNSLGYVNEVYDGLSCPGVTCGVTSGTPIAVTTGSTTAGIDFALGAGGRISGTVKDAATGLPIASVGARVYDASGAYMAYGYTNAAGVYTTSSGLPSGTYRVRTSNQAGYVDEAYDDVPCPNGSCSTTAGTLVAVAAGSTRQGIDFALVKGGRVGGTVTNAATGEPLAGVSARVYDTSGKLLASASTDAFGRYTSPALPAGPCYVRTSNALGFVDELHDEIPCPGGTCTLSAGTPVSALPDVTVAIDFQLAPGGRVSGTVTDGATGSPLVGEQVMVVDSDGRQLAVGTTGAGGGYTTATGVPPGTYYARTKAPGYLDELYQDQPCPGGSCTIAGGVALEVAAGATRAGVDFALTAAPPQTNDEIAGATPVSGLPFVAVEDTRTATTNPADPVHTCGTGTQDSNSVWFRYAATFTGRARVVTFTSNYDTVLTAYPGTSSVGAELACNDDTNGQQSEIQFDVTAGESYLVEVTDYGTPNGGTLILGVTPAPPAVTTAFATGLGQYGATLVGWVNPRGTSTTTSFEYGTTTAYGTAVAASTLEGATEQTVSTPISGLACGSTYHFRAVGTNAGGTTSGADGVFLTTACPLPTLSVGDVSVVEGDSGATMAVFAVTLSAASSQAVTVGYTTADGTATPGGDYLTTYGSLAIPAGSLGRTIAVAVSGDADREPAETFFLDLSSPSGATLADARGVATITDDDPAPTLSIGDVTVRRGASGSTTAELPVTLSSRTHETVTVAYATSDGTAVAGVDYDATAGVLQFDPGVTTGTVSVTVKAGSTPEARSFFVDLASPTNAAIGDARGEATITAAGHGFYTVTPCRSVDTRVPSPGDPLAAGVPRTVTIAGTCGVPATAVAVSLNLTVTGATGNGNVRLYPAGTTPPTTSTINFSAGLTRANNAISQLGPEGDLALLLSSAPSAHVIVDVNGYFE
jgi:hypothetical protein